MPSLSGASLVELLLRDVDELRLETTYTLNHYAAAVKRRGMDYVHEKLCWPGGESGFYSLVRVGRLDLPLEMRALLPEFAPLFSRRERDEAHRRISEVLRTLVAEPVHS